MARRCSCSGERTRPRVPAMALSPSRTVKSHLTKQRKVRFAGGGETSTRGACAPRAFAYKTVRLIEFHGCYNHRLLPLIQARVRVRVPLLSVTATQLVRFRRDDGVP